jgi:RimJ/RimL family protein N-acetyltransferase
MTEKDSAIGAAGKARFVAYTCVCVLREVLLAMDRLTTERLVLRPWRPTDLEAFAALNADPRVMEFYPATLTRPEAEAVFRKLEQRLGQHGLCKWAVELKETQAFIGSVGLNVPDYPLPFSPCVEVGWKLAFDYWGHGYAQEGARAAVSYGFEKLRLAEIVAFTSAINERSRKVMERIGMTYDPDSDFDHPHVAEGHRLRRHVLYRKRRDV